MLIVLFHYIPHSLKMKHPHSFHQQFINLMGETSHSLDGGISNPILEKTPPGGPGLALYVSKKQSPKEKISVIRIHQIMKTSGNLLTILLLMGCMTILSCISHGHAQLQESGEAPDNLSGIQWFPFREHRWWHYRNPWRVPPWVVNNPALERCMQSTLRPVPGCVHSIFRSYSRGKVSLSPQCCAAVQGLSDACFDKVFGTGLPFNNGFGPTVKKFCALADAPLPAALENVVSPAPK